MRKLAAVVMALVSGASVVIACSSSEERPAATGNSEGGATEYDAEGFKDASEGGDGSKEPPPSCRDKAVSTGETDIDCGGDDCYGCAVGFKCKGDSDCSQEGANAGAKCENDVCALCHDGITNGDETDTDCGGKACKTCGVGKQCENPSDCGSNSCVDKTCACPTDMTIVSRAGGGGAYCVSRTEVTKGQYNRFITANVKTSTQTGACLTANTDFTPGLAWPPSPSPAGNPPTTEQVKAHSMGLPVHYVDWCDAVAYCKWDKKQLCGNVDGGALAPADANDRAKSAWFNACSAQGSKTFPYGSIPYDATRCNGEGVGATGPDSSGNHQIPNTGYGSAANQDDAVYEVAVSDVNGNISGVAHNTCQGGSVDLYHMSGNVAEWEDSCDGTGPDANCAVRGGSYAAAGNAAKLQCNAARTVQRMPADVNQLKDIGFRCCLF